MDSKIAFQLYGSCQEVKIFVSRTYLQYKKWTLHALWFTLVLQIKIIVGTFLKATKYHSFWIKTPWTVTHSWLNVQLQQLLKTKITMLSHTSEVSLIFSRRGSEKAWFSWNEELNMALLPFALVALSFSLTSWCSAFFLIRLVFDLVANLIFLVRKILAYFDKQPSKDEEVCYFFLN